MSKKNRQKKQMPYPRIYVCELNSPDHFYVGTTLRLPYEREREHREGWGSKFTKKHGFKEMLFHKLLREGTSSTLEQDLTIALMCRYGCGQCRGGDLTAQSEAALRRYLPACLRDLAPTDVLPLHLRPVSQFAPELAALLDRFEMVRGLHNAN